MGPEYLILIAVGLLGGTFAAGFLIARWGYIPRLASEHRRAEDAIEAYEFLKKERNAAAFGAQEDLEKDRELREVVTISDPDRAWSRLLQLAAERSKLASAARKRAGADQPEEASGTAEDGHAA